MESHDSQMLKVTPVKNKSKFWIILCIIFGILLLLIIIAIIIYCCYFKKKGEHEINNNDVDKLIDSKRNTIEEGEEAIE